MQSVTISKDLAYSLWAYMSKKPFDEVANLAVAFQAEVGQQIAALEAAEAQAAQDATPVEAEAA